VPAGRADEIETLSRRPVGLSLVRALQVMVEQIRELESQIAQALDAHPTASYRWLARPPSRVHFAHSSSTATPSRPSPTLLL
jgi:hypothetical protein